MEWIKVRHPVTGGVATISRTALGQHVKGGWVPVDEDPVPETPLPRAGTGAAPSDSEDGAAAVAGGQDSSKDQEAEDQ